MLANCENTAMNVFSPFATTMSSQRPQRSWWSRPRTSENVVSFPTTTTSKRSQLVSTLSFATRIKPKRVTDLSPSSQDTLQFGLNSVTKPTSGNGERTSSFKVSSPVQETSKIPFTSPSTRVHSKTLPGGTQRPSLQVLSLLTFYFPH